MCFHECGMVRVSLKYTLCQDSEILHGSCVKRRCTPPMISHKGRRRKEFHSCWYYYYRTESKASFWGKKSWEWHFSINKRKQVHLFTNSNCKVHRMKFTGIHQTEQKQRLRITGKDLFYIFNFSEQSIRKRLYD